MWGIVQVSEYDGVVGLYGPYKLYSEANKIGKQLALQDKERDEAFYTYDVLAMTLDTED